MSKIDRAVENRIRPDAARCSELGQPDHGLPGCTEFALRERGEAALQERVVEPVLNDAEQRYGNCDREEVMDEPALILVVSHGEVLRIKEKYQGDGGRNEEQVETERCVKNPKIHHHQ